MSSEQPPRSPEVSPIQIANAESSTTSSGTRKRRRKTDDGDRSRVSRACDRCKIKKTRCSGKQPCSLCTSAKATCEFTAIYRRGRLPPITTEGDDGEGYHREDGLVSEQAATEFGSRNLEANSHPRGHGRDEVHRGDLQYSLAAGDGNMRHELGDSRNSDENINSATSLGSRINLSDLAGEPSRTQSSRNSPEPAQTDQQGHYVGPSSGASFLLRVQKKLRSEVFLSQNSSIFTFGDAPLSEYDPSFFVLPPKEDAKHLVARYFDFAVPTHRFLHRPTIEAFLDEFYDNLGVLQRSGGAEGKIALLFMVLAQAKDYMHPETFNGGDTSARYFQAADRQLLAEKGGVRLTSIQARLCQCFYLLSQSRVNHCWSLFGTTAHLILAIGIHRRRRSDGQTNVDLIELECRKRVFWCAYTLDNYLSASLGRPRTFHDEDIDQELPNCVSDSDLFSSHINPSILKAQSVMMAPIAHARLSKIISQILRDLYSIKPPSSKLRVTLTAKHSMALKDWRAGLSRFLDADGIDTSLMIPLFQRQRNVLNLAYWHAQILVYRPFLLSDFASLYRDDHRNRRLSFTSTTDNNITACLDAAMKITSIVNDLTESGQMYQAFWFTHYFAFCAVVVLYVYTIQRKHCLREEQTKYFEAAILCHSQISTRAKKESLAQRYSVVLDELKHEAVRINTPIAHIESTEINEELGNDSMRAMDPAQMSSNLVAGQTGLDLNSPLEVPNFTSWGDFDSLMSAVVATRSLNAAHEKIKLPPPISQVAPSSTLFTVDDLVFSRSQSIPDTPLVAYPGSSRSKSDYVHYTARDLDRFANNGANKYASIGLVPKVITRSSTPRAS
ncbi:fungal specific transcription factor domain-containing protein [Rutstroemia sp. NJR-2017a WRK4]|nr:fungal specific transcription factor domain-containing protein [Rutstroemia sp. NJR-2017a WRK4]